MVNVSPRRMLAASGIVELVTKKAVLPVEEKMEKRAADGENPDRAAKRQSTGIASYFRARCDYCTFFGAAADAAPDPASTTVAETM